MLKKLRHIIATAMVFILITFGIGIWYLKIYQPQREVQVIAEYERNAVPTVMAVKAVNAVPKGTVLTAQMLKQEPVEETALITGFVAGLNDAIGKVTAVELVANEQLSKNKLTDKIDYEDFDRYITADIPVEHFVNNNVEEGSIVDVLVDYGDGSYDVVLSKLRIYERKATVEAAAATQMLQLESQNGQSNTLTQQQIGTNKIHQDNMQTGTDLAPVAGSGICDRVTIMVNEQEQARLWLAMKLGKLDTRLYVDGDQPESRITFDVEKARVKLKKDMDKLKTVTLD